MLCRIFLISAISWYLRFISRLTYSRLTSPCSNPSWVRTRMPRVRESACPANVKFTSSMPWRSAASPNAVSAPFAAPQNKTQSSGFIIYSRRTVYVVSSRVRFSILKSVMAQTATIYNLDIDLSDVDRGVYEKFNLCVARHPSETLEYMLMRVFAYCLEYGEGMTLTEGGSAGDEPAVLGRDLTGRITAWIEVGMPDPERLHRGNKLAGRAAVYTHRDVGRLLSQLSSSHVHRMADIPVYEF